MTYRYVEIRSQMVLYSGNCFHFIAVFQEIVKFIENLFAGRPVIFLLKEKLIDVFFCLFLLVYLNTNLEKSMSLCPL